MMKNVGNKAYFTTAEVAKILKISRVAVFQKIKRGQLRAERFGRSYLIARESLETIQGVLTDERKREIDRNVERIAREYGEALRLLGKE